MQCSNHVTLSHGQQEQYTSELSFSSTLFITSLFSKYKNEHTMGYHVCSYCHLFACDYRGALDFEIGFIDHFNT
jgi:hypothetical protein